MVSTKERWKGGQLYNVGPVLEYILCPKQKLFKVTDLGKKSMEHFLGLYIHGYYDLITHQAGIVNT